MRLAARNLIVDLLSSMRGHPMPVRALVAAGDVFGIRPESVRVALVRLLEHGTISRNERGYYRLADAAQAVQEHVVTWTRVEERLGPWAGDWIAVYTAGLPRADRRAVRRRVRALGWLGLRPLEDDLWVRPDNLRGGAEAARADLGRLGLEAAAPVFAISKLDPATEERARSLWDAPSVRRAYRETCTALEHSAARLPKLPAREAMVESFLLGGDALKQIVLDPLLPEPIVPAAERHALVEAMRRYDRLGRDCWKPFLREHGAAPLRAPRTTHHVHPLHDAATLGA